MSLTLALQNALSGMNAAQKSLSVLSNNIANANTEGYTRKLVNQSALYIDKQPSGVIIEGISRKVDEYLSRATRYYGSEVAQSAVVSDYYDKAQIFFGKPGTETTLNAYIDQFFNSMRDLSDNPESSSIRQSAVNSAVNMANEVSALATSIQDLRFQVEQDLNLAVSEVNNLLSKMDNVNAALNNSYVNGFADTGMLDQRDMIMKELSSYMDIKAVYQESGAAYLYTGPGVSLVDVSSFQLRYSPLTSVDALVADSNFNPIQVVAVDDENNAIGVPQNLVTGGKSDTITTVITSGKIKGLLEIRDTEFPNMLAQLDELAATLRDAVNAIHNDGVGYPPPEQLTGTNEIRPTDFRDWGGTVQFAIVGKDGRPLENPFDGERGGLRPLNLSLGGLDLGNGQGRVDNQTIIDEINSHFGPQQKRIQVGTLNNVQLVSMVENNPQGNNFTFDFDLSNISDENSSISVQNITIGGGGASTTVVPMAYTNVGAGQEGRTGAGYSFDVAFAGAPGPRTITLDIRVRGDATDPTSYVDATIQFTVDTSDPALTNIKNDRFVGDLLASTSTGPVVYTASEEMPQTFGRYARAYLVDENGVEVPPGDPGFLKIEVEESDIYGLAINEGSSQDLGIYDSVPPTKPSYRGFSHYMELNNFFVANEPLDPLRVDANDYKVAKNSAYNMRVRDDIIRNPNLTATGELISTKQPSNPLDAPVYTVELGAGGSQVAARMAALARQNVTFTQAGSLPATSKPINDYTSDIIGAAASKTKLAQSEYDKDLVLAEGFETKADAVSGVNLDEELANTILYQNAYTASARVVTVTNELFDQLLQMV